jgi:glycosyltransferase involved in cell wall biosynthesis
MKVLFIYLKAFSFTGGIEKFNRSFLKALHELSIDGMFDADAFSSYDNVPDEKYFPRLRFRGYDGYRFLFVVNTFIRSFKYDTIILGHINLAVIGCIVKWLRPSVKLVVVAHGIEVWHGQKRFKKRLLQEADIILAVSNYTKDQIVTFNPSISADKIKIFPNTVDPYFELPKQFVKPKHLLEYYKIHPTKKILLTVNRMSFSEKNKGYDIVIEVLGKLKQKREDFVYLICGKYDKQEERRIKELIKKNEIEGHVQLTGYIQDKALNDHYLLSDLFVMPSRKEGFGIVFIEALACGRNVIAGNKDGSVDALLNGALGRLINPDDLGEIQLAIEDTLNESNPIKGIELQQQVITAFGFEQYKMRLKKVME